MKLIIPLFLAFLTNCIAADDLETSPVVQITPKDSELLHFTASGRFNFSFADIEFILTLEEKYDDEFLSKFRIIKQVGGEGYKLPTFLETLRGVGYPFVITQKTSNTHYLVDLAKHGKFVVSKTKSGYHLIWDAEQNSLIGSVGPGMAMLWKLGDGEDDLKKMKEGLSVSDEIVEKIKTFEDSKHRNP